MRKVLPTALAVLLSGCMIGPDYQRPDLILPESYIPADETPADNAVAVNPEWWRLFNDETLNQLLAEALENNQDLQAAIARMEAAEAAAREAGASYFPDVSLNTSASRNRTSGETSTGQPSMMLANRHIALNVNYELDLWGSIRRQNEAARAQALSSRFARDTVRLSLTAQLAYQYLTQRLLEAQVQAAKDTLESREETLKIIQSRQNAGSASMLETSQAEVSFFAAKTQLAEFRRLRALSENQIGLLVGRPGFTMPPAEKPQELTILPAPPVPPAGLPSTLLESRPDIRQAEESLIAANARIGVAKSAYFPVLGLTGFWGTESETFSRLFTTNTIIWSYGGSLILPIFNAGKTGARVDQATAAQKEALANYIKTIQTSFQEVRDALISIQEIKEGETALSSQLEAAKRALSLSNARYEAGYSGFLEVLDSQRTTYAAQTQYLTARRDHLAAIVNLFKALGGGWQENTPLIHEDGNDPPLAAQ